MCSAWIAAFKRSFDFALLNRNFPVPHIPSEMQTALGFLDRRVNVESCNYPSGTFLKDCLWARRSIGRPHVAACPMPPSKSRHGLSTSICLCGQRSTATKRAKQQEESSEVSWCPMPDGRPGCREHTIRRGRWPMRTVASLLAHAQGTSAAW